MFMTYETGPTQNEMCILTHIPLYGDNFDFLSIPLQCPKRNMENGSINQRDKTDTKSRPDSSLPETSSRTTAFKMLKE